MRGFPKHIATRQDFENLLSMEEYKEEALEKLEELQDFDDRTVTRAIKPLNPDDPNSEWETEEIENPNPQHNQKGFSKWREIVTLNAEHSRGNKTIEERKTELLNKYTQAEIKKGIVEET